MPDMEGLCDIDGGVVDANRFAAALVGRAVFCALARDTGEHVGGKPRLVHFKIEIAVDCGDFGDDLVGRDRFRKLLRDDHGAFFKHLCKAEAGQCEIPHRGIGRNGEQGSNFLLRHALHIDFLCDILFIIHSGSHLFEIFSPIILP